MTDKNEISTALITLGKVQNTCFVVMPFRPVMDRVYRKVFIPAIESTNLAAVRGDEKYGQRRIITDIWEDIRASRCVLAELTGKNSNVLYELGLSHALGKPAIIVTSDLNDVPFDLRNLRCIVYDRDQPDWGELLKKDISETIKAVLENHNPSEFLKDIEVRSAYPELPEKTLVTEIKHKQEYNLEGEWTMKETYDRGKTTALVHLVQRGNELQGNIVITDKMHGEKEFIIRESVSGYIEDKKISLSGTSFQVVRGPASQYELDQWTGVIEDPNTIKGTSGDADGATGDFIMKRS